MVGDNDDPFRSLCMGEFSPGLWIGNLQSVQYIFGHRPQQQQHTNTETTTTITTAWTIVSVLESDQLLNYVRNLIEQQQQQQQPQSAPSTIIVHRHVTWKLPDRNQAHFLSDTLLQVLACMDESTFLRNNNKNAIHSQCLVHCAKGISRSAAVCAAWLMHRLQRHDGNNGRAVSLADAMAALRRVRPEVQPNLGLTAALWSIQTARGNVREAVRKSQGQRSLSTLSSPLGHATAVSQPQQPQEQLPQPTRDDDPPDEASDQSDG
jgi:predicted protein tyrosine phosphatase